MSYPIHQSRPPTFSALGINFFESPSTDPSSGEIWCYTSELSYDPDGPIDFRISTGSPTYSIEVIREGVVPETVYRVDGLPGKHQPTDGQASINGCGWEATHVWRPSACLRSGAYRVICRTPERSRISECYQHLFIVRPRPKSKSDHLLLVCATSTWIAYNGWGGSSHYEGDHAGPAVNEMSPILSTQRPWARGQVWLPKGAPRIVSSTIPDIGDAIRYPTIEWAYAYGFSKFYAAAGWAMYERLFVDWAEREGYTVDVIAQHDLHFRSELPAAYRCVVIVGHDEYWSTEMRDAIDAYVAGGGNVARFGANLLWQIRLEDDGHRQICYKYSARERDPCATANPKVMTSSWHDPRLARMPAQTFGLNSLRGVYAGWAGMSPRHSKGFTVYRPQHWAFEGADLYYGDTFGSAPRIFGFEVDGVDFTFRAGLPYPTFADGAPESLEVLALAPSANLEEDHQNPGTGTYIGSLDADFAARMLTEAGHADAAADTLYGAGMIGVFVRGSGTVFCAGTCEWVVGLRARDPICERITHNVLRRFLAHA